MDSLRGTDKIIAQIIIGTDKPSEKGQTKLKLGNDFDCSIF